MPNPNHDPETGQFAPHPTGDEPAEPAGPDWSAFEQAGITPEMAQEVVNAHRMYQGLNNLDTRQQYLDQIIKPDLDGYTRAQQEQPDPWSTYQEGEEEGQYYEEPPQQQPFDPRQLVPVFEGYAERVEQNIFQKLGQMAQQQAIEDSAAQALQSNGLPASFASALQQQVQQITSQYANRQPGEVANQVAAQMKQEMVNWAQTNLGQPPPAGSPPPSGAPVPSGDAPPRNDDEAMQRSLERLDPTP